MAIEDVFGLSLKSEVWVIIAVTVDIHPGTQPITVAVFSVEPPSLG